MTDFALYHEGQWRDGELPKISGATYIVSHDTRHHAYHIQKDEYDDFLHWVGSKFSSDYDPMFSLDFEGDIDEYLDEIGVSVREV